MSRSYEIRGDKALVARLKKIATMDDVKEVVKVNTTEVQRGAQRKAPVDTGNLRRSIGIEFTDGGLTGRVSPTAEYAAYLEFGTRFMTAQPFMRPTFYQQVNQFKKDLDRLVR